MKVLVGAIVGVLCVFFGVLLGAMGSHLLAEKIDQDALQSFRIATRYMLFHGLALLLLPVFPYINDTNKSTAALFLVIGTVLFSGSIVILSTKAWHGASVSFLGPITPIGGLFLLMGWAYIAFHLVKTLYLS